MVKFVVEPSLSEATRRGTDTVFPVSLFAPTDTVDMVRARAEFHTACGTCYPCSAGETYYCTSWRMPSIVAVSQLDAATIGACMAVLNAVDGGVQHKPSSAFAAAFWALAQNPADREAAAQAVINAIPAARRAAYAEEWEESKTRPTSEWPADIGVSHVLESAEEAIDAFDAWMAANPAPEGDVTEHVYEAARIVRVVLQAGRDHSGGADAREPVDEEHDKLIAAGRRHAASLRDAAKVAADRAAGACGYCGTPSPAAPCASCGEVSP